MGKQVAVHLKLLFCLLAACTVLLPPRLHATRPPEVNALRTSIISLDTVVRKTLARLSSVSGNQTVSAKEQSELLQFTLFLQSRVTEYCRRLAEQEGIQALEGLPCPPPDVPSTDMPALPAEPEASENELSSLDSELTRSLGTFDEMLLVEEKQVAKSRPARVPKADGYGSAGGNAYQSEHGGEPHESQSRGTKTRQGTKSDSGASPSQDGQGERSSVPGGRQGKSGGKQESGNQGKIAVDDDIVARQLREAAEKEQDPVLREKLWQEYYRYTGKKP